MKETRESERERERESESESERERERESELMATCSVNLLKKFIPMHRL